jgi:hypothetical protein
MRTVGFFAGTLFILTHFFNINLHATSHFVCAGFDPEQSPVQTAKALIGRTSKLPSRGQINVLVVFAQFKDEAQTPVPAFAADLFDAQLAGSFTHFYDTMSLGQLQVQGTVLPKRYTSDQTTAAYQANDDYLVGG